MTHVLNELSEQSALCLLPGGVDDVVADAFVAEREVLARRVSARQLRAFGEAARLRLQQPWLFTATFMPELVALEVKALRYAPEVEAALCKTFGKPAEYFYLGTGVPYEDLPHFDALLLDNCPGCGRRGYHLVDCAIGPFERRSMRRGEPLPALHLVGGRRG